MKMRLYEYLFLEQAKPSKKDLTICGRTFNQINIKDEEYNILHTWDWWHLRDVSIDIREGRIRIIPKLLFGYVAIDVETHTIYSVKNKPEDRDIDLKGWVVTDSGIVDDFGGNEVEL